MTRKGRPPGDLLREANWRKDRDLTWFHKVTSELNEAQVIEACKQHGLNPEGKSLHEMQTHLLQIGPPEG